MSTLLFLQCPLHHGIVFAGDTLKEVLRSAKHSLVQGVKFGTLGWAQHKTHRGAMEVHERAQEYCHGRR